MARSRKKTKTEPAEIAVEDKHTAIATYAETPLEPVAVAPQWQEAVATMEPSHVERHRPDGPRKRGSDELANIFASGVMRVDKDGETYQVTFGRELSANEYAQMQKWGFNDVTERDDGSQWVGWRKDLIKAGTDINQVAFRLGKNPETPGRSR